MNDVTSTPAPLPAPAASKPVVPFGAANSQRSTMAPIPPKRGIFAPVVPGAGQGNRNVIWLSAACALVAVILLIVIIARMGSSKNPPVVPNSGGVGGSVPPPGSSGGTTVGGSTVIGGSNNGNNNNMNPLPPNNPTNNNVVVPQPPMNKGQKGTVQDATVIQWSQEPKGQLYVAIASYSSKRPEYARKAADFLAENGVNVVLLTNTEKETIRVFMREGFAASAKTDQEAAIARIRKIGELHPDFKKTGVSVFAPYLAQPNFK